MLPHSAVVFLLAAADARWHVNREAYIRKKKRAKRVYRKLLKLLGGHCQICKSTEDLSVDHINGRDWTIKRISHYRRVMRYWKEYQSGVALRCLCRSCNSKHKPSVLA